MTTLAEPTTGDDNADEDTKNIEPIVENEECDDVIEDEEIESCDYVVHSGKVSWEELLEMCRAKSCLFQLPNPGYLYYEGVNKAKKQDNHSLECIILGCNNMCRVIHPLCEHHATLFNVALDTSTIPNAGVGIFLTKSVKAGTHLMDYTGIIRNAYALFEDYKDVESRTYYEVGIDDDTSMDSRSTVCGIGRYINHHPDTDKVNVQFEYDSTRCLYKIVATKDILVQKNGKTELFLDYGCSYWDGMIPVLPVEEENGDTVTESEAEDFVPANEFCVYPSYASIWHEEDFYEKSKLTIEEMLTACRNKVLLISIPKPKVMISSFMDLSKRQTVYQLLCAVKNCNTFCTYTHPLCKKHLKCFHMEVKTSNIPHAGKGVFLLKSVRAGTVLMLYTGYYQKCTDLYKLYQKKKADFFYLFEGSKRFAIDARSTAAGLARYINHQDAHLANVELQARPDKTYFTVVASKDITVPKGTSVELYADYGQAYWKNRKYNQIKQPGLYKHLLKFATKSKSSKEMESFVDSFPTVPAYSSVF